MSSEKLAAAPLPSALPAVALPARVEEDHRQGGCAGSPGAGQADTGWQGTTGAGVPPGQKEEMGHSCVALAALVEPAGQP